MSEGVYSAGTIFLQVVPSYKGLQESIKREVGKVDKTLGDESEKSGQRAGDRAGKALGKGLNDSAEKELRKSDAFAKDFQRKIQKSLDSIGDTPGLENVARRLRALKDVDIDVDTNANEVHAEFAEIAAEAKAIGALSPDIRIQTNAAAVVGQLLAVRAAAAGASGGGDRGGSSNFLSRFSNDGQDAANSFRAFNGIILTTTTLGAGLIPIIGALSGAVAALGVAGLGAGAGLGVMLLGFSGIGDAVSAMNDAGDASAQTARKQKDASDTIRNALQAVADAERNLARARQDAAESNSDAARTTRRAVRDAAEANSDAARQTRDAVQSAADANSDAARQTADAARSAADANRRAAQEVVQAQRQSAQAVQDALRQQASAERSYAQAQRDSAQAQRDLIAAREEGRRQLDDVRDQQRQNALDERQAVIDLFNADVENTAAQQDPGATNLEKEQASINLGNARERIHEIREEGKRLAEERKKGLKGTDAVQNAQDNLTAALEAQKEAHEAVGRAAAEVDRARVQGAREVQQALREQRRTELDGIRAVKDARADERQTELDGIEAINDARRNQAQTARDGAESVGDAEREQARTAADGRESVRDAQRSLNRAQQDYKDALRDSGEVGDTALDKVRTAMSKLSPAGRRFARFLHGLAPLFYRIRAAAQEGMLPGVQRAMTLVIQKYGPAFIRFVRHMAGTIGRLFEDLGRAFRTPAFEKFFAAFDRYAPRFLRRFGHAIIAWLRAFASWATVIMPFGLQISNMLLRMARGAARFMRSADGQKDWREFMTWSFRMLPKVWKFFRALWGAAKNLLIALAPVGAVVMSIVTSFLEWIAALPPRTLRVYAIAILGILAAFQLANAAIFIFATLSGGAAAPIALIILVLAALGIAFYKLWQRSKTFRDVFKAIWKSIKNAAVDVWKLYLKPIFDQLKKSFHEVSESISLNWKSTFRPVLHGIGTVLQWLWGHVAKKILKLLALGFVTNIKIITFTITHLLIPGFRAIVTAFRWIWTHGLKPLWGQIQKGWRGLGDGFKWVWDHIIKPAWNHVRDAAKFLWERVLKPYWDHMRKGWRNLGDDIRWVWEHIIKAAWGHLQDGVRAVRDTFKNVVQGIKTWWDKMVNIAKNPVRFVVETVINKGLIGGFNKVADFLNIGKMDPVKLPKGFARGGIPSARDMAVYPGYTPGRDIGFVGVSGGEGILRPEATRAIGSGWVEGVNQAARNGGQNAVRRFLGGFARGGVVEDAGRSRGRSIGSPDKRVYWDGQAISKIAAAQLKLAEQVAHIKIHVMQGGFGGAHIAASGSSHNYPGVVDASPSNGNFKGLERLLRRVGFAAWARNVPGRSSVGSGKHVHAASLLDPGNRNSAQITGSWPNHGNGLSGYHNDPAPHYAWLPGLRKRLGATNLAQLGGGGGGGGGFLSGLVGWMKSFVSGPVDWLKGKVAGPLDTMKDKFGSFMQSPMGKAVTGFPSKILGGMASFLTDHLPSFGGGAGPGTIAGVFGGGIEGIFRSLMSTGFYSKRQAAGVMGNMKYESGFDPKIVQGGGHKNTPAGVSNGGWGLVQWTPGQKILPYLQRLGGFGVAEQITALTQQLRGQGSLAEGAAGRALRSKDTPGGAAEAFAREYERPSASSLASTLGGRKAAAESIFRQMGNRNLILDSLNGKKRKPVKVNLMDDGGIVPPGLSAVLNMTGGNEHKAVFTSDQWDVLRGLAEGGTRAGVHYEPHFYHSDLTAADVSDDLLHSLRRAELGGVYTGARG